MAKNGCCSLFLVGWPIHDDTKWWFPKIGVPPNHPVWMIELSINYKPTIWGIPHLWKPPTGFKEEKNMAILRRTSTYFNGCPGIPGLRARDRARACRWAPIAGRCTPVAPRSMIHIDPSITSIRANPWEIDVGNFGGQHRCYKSWGNSWEIPVEFQH